jgi:hypothetical protein
MDVKRTEKSEGSTPENSLHFDDLLQLLNTIPPRPVLLIHPSRIHDIADVLGYVVEDHEFDSPASRKILVMDDVMFVVSPMFVMDIIRVDDREFAETITHEFVNAVKTRLCDQLWTIKR